MARIVLQTPDGNLFESDLSAPRMSIGRTDENDLCLPDNSVSSNHGEFTTDGDAWSFTDLGSTNGTKVNGERVTSIDLGNGAKFEIGNVLCTFYDEEAAAPAAAAHAAPRSVSSNSGAGYGSRTIERAARTGFGPKKVKGDPTRLLLMLVGFIAVAACVGVALMISNGGLK
jgi:pSer/pThr/pTyr-binding forkhead associated (FHA) protein